MTTSKPRVRAYVDHDTYAKLQFATTRPHVSISDTVNNALKVYLSDEYKRKRPQLWHAAISYSMN